jgi:putative ABC transport system substrate-binding protein
VKVIVRYLLCWMLCLTAGSVCAADIAVVSSERTAGYMETLDSLVSELGKSNLPVTDVDLANGPGKSALFGSQRPRAIVTLGSEALRQVLELDLRLPVLAVLIPRTAYERIVRGAAARANVSALYLDQPVSRQLDLIRIAFPAVHKVGVLWGDDSIAQQAAVNTMALGRGLTLIDRTVGRGRTVAGELNDVLDGAEVFLAVPDPQVFNPNTLSNVLMSTYRSRVPLVGFSPAYVRAGATLSLHSLPTQAGARAAVMVRQFLTSGVLPASQYPLDFSIAVNERVARSLELSLDANALTEQLKRMERRP